MKPPEKPGPVAPVPDRSARLESWTKLGALMAVSLYVVGMVITNIHLMTLGISDFSLIQAQGLATGALFALYVLGLVVLAAPTVIVLYLRDERVRKVKPPPKGMLFWWLPVQAVMACGLLGLASLAVPWGATVPEIFATFGWTAWKIMFANVQLGWTLFAGVMPLLFTLLVVAVAHPALMSDDSAGGAKAGQGGTRMTVLFVASLMLIWSFARHAYPNMARSVGGGQPPVVRLQLEEPKAEPAATAASAASAAAVPASAASAPPILQGREEVLVWHQTDKFLYVHPLASAPGAPRLVAIKLDRIAAIEYSPKTVELDAAGRVIAVHLDR